MLFKNTVVFLNGGTTPCARWLNEPWVQCHGLLLHQGVFPPLDGGTREQCLVRGGLMSHGSNVMAHCCIKVGLDMA